MARARVLLVTLYLDESAKGPEHSDRMWNQLTALDFCILEEHHRAGAIVGEFFGEDTAALERVPGVAALISKEQEPVFETVPKAVAPRLHKRAA